MEKMDTLLHNVRMIMAGGGLPASLDPSVTARELADLYERVNQRVQNALALFKNGQQREAVELIERSPDLFDIIRGLGNPSLAQWPAFCKQNGWPVPQHLDDVALSELNGRYAEALNIDTLITKYQIAARSKDYIMCIQYLRAICKGTKNENREWSALLKKYEATRLQALATQLENAENSQNLATLESLHCELSQEWMLQNERNRYLAEVDEAIKNERTRRDTREATSVVAELEQAYGDKDLAETIRQLEHFDAIEKRGHIVKSRSMEEACEDARTWRDSENARIQTDEQFKATYEKLVEMLHRPDPPGIEFLKSWDHLRHFCRPLPEEIVGRAQITAERIKRRLKTRRIVQVSLACALGLLFLGSALSFWQRVQYNRQVAECLNALGKPLAAGELSVALDTVAAVREMLPQIAEDPQVMTMISKIFDWEAEINSQLAALDSSLASLRATIDGMSTDSRDLRGQKSHIMPWLNGIENNAVWRYAGDGRQLVLRECKADWENHRRTMQIALDTPVREISREVVAGLGQFDILPDLISEANEKLSTLEELLSKLKNLALDDVTEGVKDTAVELRDRIEERLGVLSEKRHRMQRLNQATSLHQYLDLLQEFADNYPESRRIRFVNAILEQRQRLEDFATFNGQRRHSLADENVTALAEDGYWRQLHNTHSSAAQAVKNNYGHIMECLTNLEEMDALVNLWNIPLLRRRVIKTDVFGDAEESLSDFMSAIVVLPPRYGEDYWATRKTLERTGRTRLTGVKLYIPSGHAQCEQIREELGVRGTGGRVFQGNEFLEQDIEIHWSIDKMPLLMPHCGFFQTMLNYVEKESAEGKEDNLVPLLFRLIEKVAMEPQVPLYLKGKLVDTYSRHLMAILPASSLPAAVAKMADSLASLDFDYPWLSQMDLRDQTYHSTRQIFAASEINADAWIRHHMIRQASAEILFSCGVRWCGAVSLFEDEPTARFIGEQPHDVWTLEFGSEGKMSVRLVYSKNPENRTKQSFALRLPPGTPLFTPNIGTAFGEYVTNHFEKLGIVVPDAMELAACAGGFWPKGYETFLPAEETTSHLPNGDENLVGSVK